MLILYAGEISRSFVKLRQGKILERFIKEQGRNEFINSSNKSAELQL